MKPISRTYRSVALAASAVSLALLATACGGGDGGSADAESGGGKPVTLTMWSWMVGQKDVVAEFNRTHKDIRIDFTEIPGGVEGYAKISGAIKGGNAPDIIGMEYGRLPEFASQGQLEDLSGPAGELVKTFPENIRSLVSPGGKTWGVPFDVTPQLLYYRTDLFEKAGVEVPATWDEFRSAAEKIKKADKKVRITNVPAGGDVPVINGLFWQAGSAAFGIEGDAWTVDVDDAAAQKAAKFFDGLVKDDLAANLVSWSEEEGAAKKNGTIASFIGAPWSGGGLIAQMPELKGKWATAPLPTWDGKPATGMWGGTSVAVPKGSGHVEEAVEFAEWMTTDPAAMEARLKNAEAPSSALPVKQELQDVARTRFAEVSQGYFANDIYETAAAQIPTIVPGWTWGPVQGTVDEAFNAAVAKGGWTAGLAAAQQAAEKALADRGLKTAE
ncbi:sugar ABC transporter substrate-binding protein [Streptomyces sp. NPDC051940]|uniref:ABC transporter substrate-binding protein n=1 Tax=Streptomyces sp. NPDC051940 TaxID=3155675 RepID=UPI00341CA448